MRVSTSFQHQLGVNAMLDQHAKLAQTQLKLSSGKKYLTPSENSVAAADLINFQQNIKVNEQFQVNINMARQRLELQESSLGNATETIHRIKDLAIQGLNGINTQENRKQIAKEIDQLNEHLFSLANTRNANGEYIFSGTKTDTAAYSFSAGSYSFDGEPDSQRRIAIGPERSLTDADPGNQVFGDLVAEPMVPGSITNIFQAVAKLSQDFQADQPNSNSLTDLDQAMKRFDMVRASTGARLHALDSQETLNADYILENQATASEIGDLDYADALSRFNLQQVSLQAAQQAFSKVQNLSLFNYL
jgi:flagellar hook-associated protein 3 FlgL